MTLSQERAIRERYIYDPVSGELRSRKTGKVLGSKNLKGYLQLNFKVGDKRASPNVSRIIWFLQTGEWPEQVDHINRIRDDNRWENLREASASQNVTNRCYPKKSSLPVGVRPSGRGYMARMNLQGRYAYLGTFDTPEEASMAYQQAVLEKCGPGWYPEAA